MISIRKYLLMDGGKNPVPAPAGESRALAFADTALAHIGEFVLVPSGDERWKTELEGLRDLLRPGWTELEAVEAGQRLARLLGAQREAAQQAGARRALELQHIFAMLNQALIALAEGRTRSVSRLQKIQQSLEKTSLIEDLAALRSSLADTVKLVQQESHQEQEAAAVDLAGVQTEMSRAREALGRAGMAGRAEAVAAMEEFFRARGGAAQLHLLAFAFDRLEVVSQRYGPQVIEELFSRLIRERLEPVVPGADLYRWTDASLVALSEKRGGIEELRLEVAARSRAPLVHRVALGNRTAVLNLNPSHLAAEGRGEEAASLIEQVDRFTGWRA